MYAFKVVTTVFLGLLIATMVYVAVRAGYEKSLSTGLIAGLITAIEIMALFCMWM